MEPTFLAGVLSENCAEVVSDSRTRLEMLLSYFLRIYMKAPAPRAISPSGPPAV